MSERQATPDLLGKLMSGTEQQEESNKAISIADGKAIKPESNKTIRPAHHKAIKEESNKAIKQAAEAYKEKATFNLSKTLLSELEDVWADFRRELDSKQISKTLVVEAALRLAFDELKAKRQESKLYCFIASNKTIKK